MDTTNLLTLLLKLLETFTSKQYYTIFEMRYILNLQKIKRKQNQNPKQKAVSLNAYSNVIYMSNTNRFYSKGKWRKIIVRTIFNVFKKTE